MPESHKTTFIINPRSGKLGGKDDTISAIRKIWAGAAREFEIFLTTCRGEGEHLAREATGNGSKLIIAVGGDGTLNEVVRGVQGRDVTVGLMPAGSGNGFARYWDIPLDPIAVCKGLLNPRTVHSDVGAANGHLFLVTFGCGLDAELSVRYAKSQQRGMVPYFYHGLLSLLSYKPVDHEIEIEGKIIYSGRPLILSVANTKGYGGGTVIAPGALPNDGVLDLCIIEPLPLWSALIHLPKVFNGNIDQIPRYYHFPFQELVIHRSAAGPIHVDGDPFETDETIRLSVHPSAIKIALPTLL